MKRNYIIIGILVVLIAGFGALRTGRMEPATTTSPRAQTGAATTTAVLTGSSPADNVTLKAGGKTYGTYITETESVLDLMRTFVSASDFTYTGKDYPSLGFFVESIGGIKSGDGYYWILYINGKSSDVGASQAHVRPGDTVEWRYEKGN